MTELQELDAIRIQLIHMGNFFLLVSVFIVCVVTYLASTKNIK